MGEQIVNDDIAFDRPKVFADIVTMLAACLDVDPAKINSASILVDDLGADSLDMVDFTMWVEERYGFEITDDQMLAIRTVDDLTGIIGRWLAENKS